MQSQDGKTVKSVVWSAVERLSSQGIQFVMGIIIARLLLPSDYGVVAMLTIFLALAQTFVDSGFGTALVQKKDRTETDYSTVFIFNIVVALLVYLLLFFAAPLIAAFYDEPLLTPVTRVAGLTLIISSMGLIQTAKMTIALNFKSQAMATIAAVITSGLVGVGLAWKGYGVWALVVQTLVNSIVFNGLLWIQAKWMPNWQFSMQSFRSLFSFGSKLLFSSLLHTLYTNIYSLVIGKRFASQELGFFNRSSMFANFPSNNLAHILVRVVYPIECTLQDRDEELKSYYIQYTRLACFVIFPIMLGMVALADPFILFLLGDKWMPAVPSLRVLSLAFMWAPVMKLTGTLLNAKGRSDYFLKAEIYKKISAFAILIATIPFGVLVMCWGLVLYSLVDVYVITIYTKKLLGLGFWQHMKALAPSLLLSGGMAGLVYASTFLFDQAGIQLVAGTLLGLVVYFGLAAATKVKEMTYAQSLIKGLLARVK